MTSTTRVFVDYLFEKMAMINKRTIINAERCKQDFFAVAAAGAVKNRKHWEKLLNGIPSGCSAIIGYPERIDSKTAALINGFNAHTLELDDGHRFGMLHLGASIISAIKAIADSNDISDEKVNCGIIMGYEAACRLAVSIQPSHKKLGYHASGTCGTIGSAIGVAFALGMTKEQINIVLTCAAGSAAGMLELQEQKSELKPYNVGRAAMDGIMAAYMGFTDFETPDDTLCGERGFFNTFTDNYDAMKLVEHHEYFEIDRVYIKPFASCRHSHSAVEAAIKLHNRISIENIKQIEVFTYSLAVKGHNYSDIKGESSAKLSIPYAVAAGLIYGRADITVFEPVDKKIVDLAKKIVVLEDPEFTSATPQKRIALVKVYLDDGTCVESRVDYAKGEPENPMNDIDIAQKQDMLLMYMNNYKIR